MSKDTKIPTADDLKRDLSFTKLKNSHGEESLLAGMSLSIALALCTNGLQENVNFVRSLLSAFDIPAHVMFHSLYVGLCQAEYTRLDGKEDLNDVCENIRSYIEGNLNEAVTGFSSVEDNEAMPEIDPDAEKKAAEVWDNFMKECGLGETTNDGNQDKE